MSALEAKARIESLDLLRGFALLGILIVNAPMFAAPWQTGFNPSLPPLAVSEATYWAWFVPHVFFEGKCIALFSMLFGVSLFLVGGDGGEPALEGRLRRRLFWLAVFGIAHGTLIWNGDVLLYYAIAGFCVSFARAWPTGRLLAIGTALSLGAVLFNFLAATALAQLSPDVLAEVERAAWAPDAAERARIVAAYQGGLASATAENVRAWINYSSNGIILISVRAAGLMMIGLALFKWGYLSGRSPNWLYALMLVAGAACLALIALQSDANARLGFPFVHILTGGTLANEVLAPIVSLAYAAALILLARAGLKLAPLAAVGRMAFSNYLAQSLIMTTIFWSGRGLGLFGELGRPELLGVVAAVWAAQLIWSPLWLVFFRLGPLEWVWRSLTAMRPVALLHPKPPAAAS